MTEEIKKLELNPNKHYLFKITENMPVEEMRCFAEQLKRCLNDIGVCNVAIIPNVDFEIIED